MQVRTKIACAIAFVAASLAANAPLYAQNRASITGTVRDSTGAVLPAADVAVTDVATGVTLKTTTNTEGDYLVAGLPESTYNLKIAASGFSSAAPFLGGPSPWRAAWRPDRVRGEGEPKGTKDRGNLELSV